MTDDLPPGFEMRTTSNGLPVVYVPYDHNTSVIADCHCGYLVDPQWLPILILRGVKA